MRICDRCKGKLGDDIRKVYFGISRWGDTDDEEICGETANWKYGELCKSCRKAVAKKIIATVEQDEIQPSYSLPPRSTWAGRVVVSLVLSFLTALLIGNMMIAILKLIGRL